MAVSVALALASCETTPILIAVRCARPSPVPTLTTQSVRSPTTTAVSADLLDGNKRVAAKPPDFIPSRSASCPLIRPRSLPPILQIVCTHPGHLQTYPRFAQPCVGSRCAQYAGRCSKRAEPSLVRRTPVFNAARSFDEPNSGRRVVAKDLICCRRCRSRRDCAFSCLSVCVYQFKALYGRCRWRHCRFMSRHSRGFTGDRPVAVPKKTCPSMDHTVRERPSKDVVRVPSYAVIACVRRRPSLCTQARDCRRIPDMRVGRFA